MRLGLAISAQAHPKILFGPVFKLRRASKLRPFKARSEHASFGLDPIDTVDSNGGPLTL